MDGIDIIKIIEQLGVSGALCVILFYVVRSLIDKKLGRVDKETENKFSATQEHIKQLDEKNAQIAELQKIATEQRMQRRDNQFKEVWDAVKGNREHCDNQMKNMEAAFTKHVQLHQTFEKSISMDIENLDKRQSEQITRIYDRLNPMGETLSKLVTLVEMLVKNDERKTDRLEQLYDMYARSGKAKDL